MNDPHKSRYFLIGGIVAILFVFSVFEISSTIYHGGQRCGDLNREWDKTVDQKIAIPIITDFSNQMGCKMNLTSERVYFDESIPSIVTSFVRFEFHDKMHYPWES